MNIFVSNGLWLLGEKVLNVLGGLVITIYTARYLGPENMGSINLALVIISLLTPLAQLGSLNLIYDQTSKSHNKGLKLVIVSQSLIFKLSVILSLILLAIVEVTSIEIDRYILLGILISGLFGALDTFKPYFDATLQSKKTAISAQIGLIVSHTSRLILVLMSKSLIFFVIPYILQKAVPFIIRKNQFKKECSERKLKKKEIEKYKNFLVCSGLPLALSALSVVIYLKINQLFLGNLVGLKELGVYSAAATLSQGWLFLPTAIMTVLLGKVINNKKSRKEGFSFVILVCVSISIMILILMSFNSDLIIKYSYGDDFKDAASILPILTLASVFSIIGLISSRAIITYSGYRYLLKKTLVTAMLNCFLSYYLILKFGMLGASYAILITEIVSATFFNYCFNNFLILRIHIKIISSIKYLSNFRAGI
ncbi:MAG: oligosaccharide flippase family protein [Vibrio litoralis]|uniref:oligosaccharide flippase family protein n=1 Tax=Vibrio litoralis TaxID=335972 RepID=UPI003F9618E6